jgi:hypothetical protein
MACDAEVAVQIGVFCVAVELALMLQAEEVRLVVPRRAAACRPVPCWGFGLAAVSEQLLEPFVLGHLLA